MKIAFYTLGCKVNQYETEAMMEAFIKDGFEKADFDEVCDIYVINTCTVTGISDRKSRQIIRRAKEINPLGIVAVTGCYAQLRPDDVSEIKGVDIVTGTGNRLELVEIVKDFIKKRSKIISVRDISKSGDFETMSVKGLLSRTRANIKIEDGCRNYCTYCAIPLARGPVRSKPLDSIHMEILNLLDNGFYEIVLTGIHLASYGLDNGLSLLEVIKDINAIDRPFRLRLGSLEPTIFSEDFVDEIKYLDKLCPHFHISLQSGCDSVLKRMGRKYLTCEYENSLKLIRQNLPDAAITTDIMVGFPGESDEEYTQSYKFIEKMRLSSAHVFIYSKRPFTKAADMPNQVDDQIKKERSRQMIDLCRNNSLEYIKSFKGRTMKVLFEQMVEKGIFEGLTSNYIPVRVKCGNDITHTVIDVMIKGYTDSCAFGEVVV